MTRPAAWGLLSLAWLAGCGGAEKTGETGSTSGTTMAGSDSGSPLDPLCVDAPVVTWDSWGQGFLNVSCQSCHRSTTPDRHGAPAEVHFDDRETTLSLADRILARGTGAEPTMPPSGGISDEDRYKLQVWLTCWE